MLQAKRINNLNFIRANELKFKFIFLLIQWHFTFAIKATILKSIFSFFKFISIKMKEDIFYQILHLTQEHLQFSFIRPAIKVATK